MNEITVYNKREKKSKLIKIYYVPRDIIDNIHLE